MARDIKNGEIDPVDIILEFEAEEKDSFFQERPKLRWRLIFTYKERQ